MKGKIKFFNETKGYGFITEDETNKDYFLHVTGLANGLKTIAKGTHVEFEVENDPRNGKVRACDVKVID